MNGARTLADLEAQRARYIKALLDELRRLHPRHNDVEGCRTCDLIRWGSPPHGRPGQIVRALATADPRAFNAIEERQCGLCWAKPKTADIEDVELLDPANHETDCPWRLAREWESAAPERNKT